MYVQPQVFSIKDKLIPQRYGDAKTSRLFAKVIAGANMVQFDLTL